MALKKNEHSLKMGRWKYSLIEAITAKLPKAKKKPLSLFAGADVQYI